MAQTAVPATSERVRRRGADRPPADRGYMILLGSIVALSLLGLVMVLSASSVRALYDYGSPWYHFSRQLLWVALGAAAMVVTMRLDYRHWQRAAGPLLALSLGLLAVVLVPGVGVEVNGSTRWLGAGPVRVQPSEVAKLAVIVFAAALLARRSTRIHDVAQTVRPVVAVVAANGILLLAQPNLGTALIVAAAGFVVLFAAGAPARALAIVGSAAVTLGVLQALTANYRRARVTAFLDPWADPLNTGYQTIQSMVGIASGGVTGVGLGASRAKWGFLPFSHTDFIFAIVAEELGLIGAVAVVGLFGVLGVFGIRAALRAPDRFGMLLAAGITSWFVLQAVVNMGAVVGRLPITGVPLPFVSFGGSSMLVSMAAAGVLLNVARQAR